MLCVCILLSKAKLSHLSYNKSTLLIVNRGKWLGRPVNINEANKNTTEDLYWKVLDPATESFDYAFNKSLMVKRWLFHGYSLYGVMLWEY